MNILKAAMSIVQGINPLQDITIENIQSILDKGIYKNVVREIKTRAQVQAHGKTVSEMTEATVDAVDKTNFWLYNLTPELIDWVKDTKINNSKIILKNGRVYTIIERFDYTYNGYIKCVGVCNESRITEKC